MRWSLPVSFCCHVAILLAGVIALPSPEEYEADQPPAVPVELLTLSELSQRQAVKQDAEKEPEKIAPPEPEKEVEQARPEPEPEVNERQAALPPQPEPEPAPPTPEPRQAEPEPQQVPEPQPEPERVPEKQAETKPPPPTPKAKPKPPPPKVAEKKEEKAFNPDEIAALLNKIPDQSRPAAQVPEDTGAPRQADVTSLIGSDQSITANEEDWLRSQIQRCWNPPVGVAGAENLIVKLRIALNQDGTVAGFPELMNSGAAIQFQAAADSAIRAVMRCQPYQMPTEKYQAWREIILNFDPSRMFPS